ncbi:MAG TPA: hypothetical protein VKZ67_01595 [Natronosporangium sp.]|jgi:hypothetical protein|nr:hypothetical protein [Natronosporangium sp.]
MGLDNVAVAWPRMGRYYEPVAPAEFADFGELTDRTDVAASTAALAGHIAKTSTVQVDSYLTLVDLLLGLEGVLSAADAEDDDPVIDPDGCGWIADGLEQFVERHRPHGDLVTFTSVGAVLREALGGGPLADTQLRWLEQRLAALADTPARQWRFPLSELAVLARFYRRCAESGFAVYVNQTGAGQP